MQIKVMSQQLANQIAAGEVVERPASVIKELIENSIDAQADYIKIFVEKAGSQYIKIIDNGHGMSRDSLKLAIKRHATSKVSCIDDLYAINTMGFRGEALASITSVARVKMASRTEGEDLGWSLQIDGGAHTRDPEQLQMAQGTSVEVMDLFFNTPARKRFMRREATEITHIDETIRKLVCAHPSIAFEYTKNGKASKKYPAVVSKSQQNDRLKVIFGEQVSSQMHYFKNEAQGMAVYGYLGSPSCTRALADCQYFIVNGRAIKDSMLSHAVKRAYSGLTYQERHPVCLINITIDPNRIDVNVHPTKERIKFEQVQLVTDFVAKSIKNELSQFSRPITSVQNVGSAEIPSKLGSPEQSTFSIEKILSEMNNRPSRSDKRPSYPHMSSFSHVAAVNTEDANTQISDQEQIVESVADIKHNYIPQSIGKALCQLYGIYVIALSEHGLVVVDMHAAHERIILEKMKESLLDHKQVTCQELLLPQPIDIVPADQEVISLHENLLLELGFVIKILSESKIIVSAIPQVLSATNIPMMIADMCAELKCFDKTTQIETVRVKILATLACHTAVRANRQLTVNEMDGLLRQIEACPHAMVCNHGRPTVITFSANQLDKFFHRGQ